MAASTPRRDLQQRIEWSGRPMRIAAASGANQVNDHEWLTDSTRKLGGDSNA
jgi:hypothetical protein